MQSTLEKKEGLKHQLKVILPAEIFKNKHKEVLNQKAKKAKIQGFRAGKVPVDVVMKYYGNEITQKAVDELIATSLKEAFNKEKVYPVGRPNIESLKVNEGEDFEYVASFEVVPSIDHIYFDHVTIEKVESKVKPEDVDRVLANMTQQFSKTAEMNEALVKRLGVASGDVAQLRQEIEKTLTRELKHKLRQDLHQMVFDKLIEQNPIDVPGSQIHEEAHQLMHQAKEQFQKMTGQKNATHFSHEMFETQAKRRIQNSYLLMKIIEDNKLKANAAEIQTCAEEIAASYENPAQVREYYLNNREQYHYLENLALENAVVNYLLGKATVKIIEKDYAELMNK